MVAVDADGAVHTVSPGVVTLTATVTYRGASGATQIVLAVR
jgi:hypothetical protein